MANQRLEKCQKEAEEVTILMKDNVEKVFEREGKLANLEVRAEELKIRAGDFQKTAQAVERKTRWEKYKWYLICAAVVLLVVIILIIILAVQFGGGGGGGGGGGEEREATQSP